MASTSLALQGLSWSQIEKLPQPPGGEVVTYGEAPSQFGELRLPAGEGPFPVAVVIHGGCWQFKYGVDHIAPLAADLNEHGIATWAIEYRRLGEPGGGWPGTFDDVATGLARLESLAADKPIDAGRMALVGHSAGGHLALWLAGRNRLPADHRWHADLPGGLRGVVGLAAISDLARYAKARATATDSPTSSSERTRLVDKSAWRWPARIGYCRRRCRSTCCTAGPIPSSGWITA